jgi:hypothetical protein
MRKKIIGGIASFLLGAFLTAAGMSGLIQASADVTGLTTKSFKVLEITLFVGLGLMILSAALFIWAIVSEANKK